jgi:hypothetical protein
LPQEGILTKEQMQAHAAENAMTLGETSFGQNAKTMDAIAKDLGYGGWHSSLTEAQKAEVNAAYDAQGMQAGTRYSQWQLPGGENYREKLLTLPSEMPETAKATINNYNVLNRRMADQMAEWKGLAEARPPGDPETLAAYQRLAATRREAHAAEDAATKIKQQYRDSTFRSSHWDEPNVLAHMRMNDREVPGVGKSLHLEEIQSDWHQKGRNEGYSLPSEQTALMDSEYRALVHKNADARARGYEPNDADVNRARELETALIRSDQSKIPDAPFKSTWPDVALKRSIRDAAEGGYDALSWTPGEAQAARYSLSNQLKELQYMKHENGTYEIAGTTKNGEGFNHPEMVTAEKLPDVVGKEMAQKIINNEGKRTRGQNYNGGYFDGIDLKVGGEGMKAFYDKMLVDKANALGKKHGARVEQQTIDKPYVDQFGKTKQEQAQPVHVLRITPQLREAAMKGFPLFSALFGATAAAPSLWPQQGRQ